MADSHRGRGQTETKVISQGTTKAEVVLITTWPDGRRTSETRHYCVVGGKFVDGARVEGGRHRQTEDGKLKPWQRKRVA